MCYKNEKGEVHRDDDLSAVIDQGLLAWFEHGLLHREGDLPAQIIRDGETQIWFKKGKKHRIGGPACIEKRHSFYMGSEQWWFEDRKHREDGPAVIYENGKKEYWIHGVEYTEEEFHHEIGKRQLNESLQKNMRHKEIKSQKKI